MPICCVLTFECLLCLFISYFCRQYFSVSVADYAKTIDLPQIGYYASTSDLSDPDKYAFFSRTNPSSSSEAYLVTNMLQELGLTQYIFILYYDDYLGDRYYQDFANE